MQTQNLLKSVADDGRRMLRWFDVGLHGQRAREVDLEQFIVGFARPEFALIQISSAAVRSLPAMLARQLVLVLAPEERPSLNRVLS
jgi:hypothetical protein